MQTQSPSNAALKKQFHQKITALWPALKGSLAKVYKPCIRPHCPACVRGDKHPAWVLSFTHQGRRRCMYVPQPYVPVLLRGLKNGRRLEQLLYQLGPALLKQHRHQRRVTKQRGTKQKHVVKNTPKN